MDKNYKTISYKLQYTDSPRYMESSLSNLVDNPAEVIRKIKSEYGHNNKKCEACGKYTKILSTFLKKQTLKMI